MKKNFKPVKILGIILLVIIFLAIFSTVVMLLWNNILATVVHVGLINFWQALGILVLSKILFGGFRGGSHWGRQQRWKHNLHDRWKNMTPEEREKFKQQLKSRCGGRFAGNEKFEEQSEPNK